MPEYHRYVFVDPLAVVSERVRRSIAGTAALLGCAFAAVQLRHGVVPMLDTASYWSGIEATASGRPMTTTLAPSFSNFDVIRMLQDDGRLPFVDFPAGYPLLAGLLAVVVGGRAAMVITMLAAIAVLVYVGVAGPRTRPSSATALGLRALIALGVLALPVFRLTTQAALSEPIFCAIAICLVCALVEYHDGGRAWYVPALLVAACGLLRFVGAALVVLLLVEMWRRRESLRTVALASAVAVVPTLVNIVWASAAGGGHSAGWRGLERDDLTTFARSVGGWFDSELGDLRLTYFAADRSLPWWVWAAVAMWLLAVAIAAAVLVATAAKRVVFDPADVAAPVGQGAFGRLPMELTVGLVAGGLLAAALIAGMAGFDALVIADNRLMLPIGVLSLVPISWSIRPASLRHSAMAFATVLMWGMLATAPTGWTESFSTPGNRAVVDPAVLPNGRDVRIVLTNDADTVHWATGVPAAYMPTPFNSLTGLANDTAAIYQQLPCALADHDGIIIISEASLFGPGDLDALQRLVASGQLIVLPSKLGTAYASTGCGAP
jgi:hypothetical protein